MAACDQLPSHASTPLTIKRARLLPQLVQADKVPRGDAVQRTSGATLLPPLLLLLVLLLLRSDRRAVAAAGARGCRRCSGRSRCCCRGRRALWVDKKLSGAHTADMPRAPSSGAAVGGATAGGGCRQEVSEADAAGG